MTSAVSAIASGSAAGPYRSEGDEQHDEHDRNADALRPLEALLRVDSYLIAVGAESTDVYLSSAVRDGTGQ